MSDATPVEPCVSAEPCTTCHYDPHDEARVMIRATGTETQHRFGKNETDIVLQALAQAIAPVGVAVRVSRPPANP